MNINTQICFNIETDVTPQQLYLHNLSIQMKGHTETKTDLINLNGVNFNFTNEEKQLYEFLKYCEQKGQKEKQYFTPETEKKKKNKYSNKYNNKYK